jgi:hypothetical protein
MNGLFVLMNFVCGRSPFYSGILAEIIVHKRQDIETGQKIRNWTSFSHFDFSGHPKCFKNLKNRRRTSAGINYPFGHHTNSD